MNKSFAIIMLFASIAYAGTTIRDQSVPATWSVAKQATTTSLKSEACTVAGGGCLRYTTDTQDLFTSTGTLAGQWRNTRTGAGP
jgi:hypothetical protein